jgi:hypothetical protein
MTTGNISNSQFKDDSMMSLEDQWKDRQELKNLSYKKYIDIFQQGIKCLYSEEILDQTVEIDGNLITGHEWLDKISKMPTDFDKKANNFFKKQIIRSDKYYLKYCKVEKENVALRIEHINLPLRRCLSICLLVAGLAIAILGIALSNIPLLCVGFVIILISGHFIRVTYTTKVADVADQIKEQEKKISEEHREEMRKEYEDEEFIKISLEKCIEKVKQQTKDSNEESCCKQCSCEVDLR